MLSADVIDQAGRRLAEAAAAPAQVFVFGSHARGDAHEDSDLDFLVVERGDRQPPAAEEMVRLRRALPPLGVPVDVIVMSEDLVRRRRDVPGSLAYWAMREGRLVAES
ncbi:MAG TPA: nucleotidyltransferase domain-containing protein [Conexibacter sp.]|nr:nucleotidyltransferase domain-containing protein [Conexibacter sp.]